MNLQRFHAQMPRRVHLPRDNALHYSFNRVCPCCQQFHRNMAFNFTILYREATDPKKSQSLTRKAETCCPKVLRNFEATWPMQFSQPVIHNKSLYFKTEPKFFVKEILQQLINLTSMYVHI